MLKIFWRNNRPFLTFVTSIKYVNNKNISPLLKTTINEK